MKKQIGLLTSVAILTTLCLGAETDSQSIKLRPAPHKIGDIVMDADWSILPREDVYEIGVSKLGLSSIQNLPDAGYRKLNEGEAKFLT
jgi:hypothetical protein